MTDAIAPGVVAARPTITLATKFFYGFGSIAYGVKDNGFRIFLLLFYNQVVGLPATLVTSAILIAMLIDCAIDPFIGQVSDNWRSKWGRRHPFMYASAVPAAASFLLLWNPPYDWSHEALFWYLIGVAVLVRTFITLYEIPSSSLGAELTLDYDERTSLLGYRYFFAYWGGLTLIIVNLLIFLQPSAEYPVGQLNRDGYANWGYVAAGVMFISILVSALGTHRYIPYLAQPTGTSSHTIAGQLKEMGAALSNRSFVIITLVGLFAAIAQGTSFSLAIYFSTYFWALSPEATSILTADAYVASAIALFAAPYLARRSGKKIAGSLLLATSVFIGFLPMMLRLLGFFPENDSPWLLPLLFADGLVRGAFGITAAILISAMLTDVVEDAAVRTGRRNEGLFFAFTSLIQKAVSGVGVMVAGVVLSIISFPVGAKPADVDPEVIRNLALVYIPVLAGLYGLAVAILQGYGITRERHEENIRLLKLQAQVAEQAGAPRFP
ncbi:MAG: MFS transporter [Alphaproteobacteria bacterium]|nr:MFS transporter [Alphaproteobacteria bacterium]